jgi:hypothetical protein
MKNLIVIMVVLAVCGTVFAADVNLGKSVLGSNPTGIENTKVVDNNILHAPQYMPNYPTAATIWPRVVEVPCTKAANGDLNCAGYNWTPAMGRGEYLFVTPKVIEPVKPTVVTVTKEVLVEVPAKPKKE